MGFGGRWWLPRGPLTSIRSRWRPVRNWGRRLRQGRVAPASPRPHPNPLPAGEGARPPHRQPPRSRGWVIKGSPLGEEVRPPPSFRQGRRMACSPSAELPQRVTQGLGGGRLLAEFPVAGGGRAAGVPVGGVLVGVADTDQRRLVEVTGHELHADGQARPGEAAGDGDAGRPVRGRDTVQRPTLDTAAGRQRRLVGMNAGIGVVG